MSVWRATRRNGAKKPIAEMMASVTKDPMAALEMAIKAGDASRFAAAYTELTEACNTCH